MKRKISVLLAAFMVLAVFSGSSAAQKAEEVSLVLTVPNSWETGGSKYIQLDGAVKNNGKQTVSGWTAEIQVSVNTKIEQKWNCEISISGGVMKVTPVEHNRNVESGREGTFGMILMNAGSIDASKAKLTFSGGAASGVSGGNGAGNSSGNSGGTVGTSNPAIVRAKDVPPPTSNDWLYAKGNKIVTASGQEVWITGINWFGYNTGTNTFDGLWTADLNTAIASIADRGFNMLRIPISTELIKEWSNGRYPTANFNQATNSYLVGMNSLEIFDYVIGQCRANGLKIMIDIHSAKSDPMGHMKNMWFDGDITEKDFINSLAWLARRYRNDDTILAYDLKNEPHGKPGDPQRAKWDNSKDPDNWKYIAEKAGLAVLNQNPNALILVEGIEIYPKNIKANPNFTSKNDGDYDFNWWGGNLRGVRDNPIDLGKHQNKLVYSPHDYGPTVHRQPWFGDGYNFNSLMRDTWHDNWFFIHKEGIAPILIGEWGGFMTEPNLTWMTHLRRLIKENRLHHTFWCFNANSGDTGGLVEHDFTTWDEGKYRFVREVLWRQDGKFVGLDHDIPLGRNGVTVAEAGGNR
ncbi:MAG: cellulase family glycosylhydrolase [Oscillospiraceae bacterium]|nr:cellulase family glycosylhydrolase [Oscillospiraceae bacterium]